MIWYLMVNLWGAMPIEPRLKAFYAFLSFSETAIEIALIGAVIVRCVEVHINNKRRK